MAALSTSVSMVVEVHPAPELLPRDLLPANQKSQDGKIYTTVTCLSYTIYSQSCFSHAALVLLGFEACFYYISCFFYSLKSQVHYTYFRSALFKTSFFKFQFAFTKTKTAYITQNLFGIAV